MKKNICPRCREETDILGHWCKKCRELATDYKATRKDIFCIFVLLVVFLFGIFLSQFGCDSHDPKPKCNYSTNTK